MSTEKRRLQLCDRDYLFPQYDILAEDVKLNATLSEWKAPSDTCTIPQSAWPKHEYPDDAVSTIDINK